MNIYGVETWDEILALFGEEGAFEGRWGWLGLLRYAQISDHVQVLEDSPMGFWFGWVGRFTETDEGISLQTMEGEWDPNVYPCYRRYRDEFHSVSELGSFGKAYRLRKDFGGIDSGPGLFAANRIYPVTSFERVDWFGAGLDTVGLFADLIPHPASWVIGFVANGISVSRSWSQFSLALATDEGDFEDLGVDLALDVVSFNPIMGPFAGIGSLYRNFDQNVYYGP